MSHKIVKQAGIIPVIEEKGKFKTLMVTSRSNPSFWIFPKGHIERELGALKSAKMEAAEEAGLLGVVKGPSLGFYRFSKEGRDYKVMLYPMKVKTILKNWQEQGQRQRKIVSFKTASQKTSDPVIRDIIDKLQKLLRKKGEL